MPIQRRSTPPTSQVKKAEGVLNSLSAWTDQAEPEEEEKKTSTRGGYRLLHPGGEGDAAGAAAEAPPPPVSLKSRLCPDVESDNFNLVIGVVIIVNAAVIGLETDWGRDSFIIFEHCFISVFVVEMVLRISQMGLGYFQSPATLFDCFLVLAGALDLWIIPLVSGGGGSAKTKSNVGYKLSILRLLRILRLMRILRVLRLFRMFNHLYLILQAFGKALQIVLLIGLIVVIIDFVCAIVLTQALSPNAHLWGEKEHLIDQWFGSIALSMHTLFVIMTLSDWDEIMRVLLEVVPAPIVIFAFVGYIMTTSYTMASLITAIISESLITSQQEYKRRKLMQIDKKRKALTGELREFLNEVHEDNLDPMGCVNHDELKQSVRGDQEMLTKLGEIGVVITEAGILQLVDKLSKDGKEVVNLEYFIDKLCNLSGAASMSSLVDLKYDLVKTQQIVGNVTKKVGDLCAKMFPEDSIKAAQAAAELAPAVYQTPSSGGQPAKRSSLKVQGGGGVKTSVKKKMQFADAE